MNAIRTPSVRIRCPSGYVNNDNRKLINDVVGSKLGLTDMVCSWSQIGPDAIVTYTVKERPPEQVSLLDIAYHIDQCKEWEYVIGLGARNAPIKISLDDDSPHICCSAGSGAGKTVLAMIIGIQVIRKGGLVFILDKKGSHRWARDLPGVVYCTTAREMHETLIHLAEVAEDRNSRALKEPEGWDPGARHFVIFEEMNATVAQLKSFWEREGKAEWEDANPGSKAPKLSIAIQAFRDLMYMGRSAKVNLFGIAQMLTANTTGGPEARENFGVRCLARYTANNWKMLVPQCAMPRASRIRGRWQIVIGDTVYETQVAYANAVEARDFALWEGDMGSDTVIPEQVTLSEAIQLGITPGETLNTLQNKRKRNSDFPPSVGTKGTAKLYDTERLRKWADGQASNVPIDL